MIPRLSRTRLGARPNIPTSLNASIIRSFPYAITTITSSSSSSPLSPKQMPTATYTIPAQNTKNDPTDIPVICTSGEPIARDQLLSFPAFRTWLSTVQHSLARQRDPAHEFHRDPYELRKIEIQAVDRFGGGRIGFVKLVADVSTAAGESLPGSIFLRGGSVAMLLILQPDDITPNSEEGKLAILTVQPRIPAGSLEFAEIPAGMLDDSGTFAGRAAAEIHEETGLSIPQSELINMTALTLELLQQQESNRKISLEEELQKAVYPSPGGSDEFIPIFLCQKRMRRQDIEALQGKLTGNRDEREKITLKLVPLDKLWKEGARDGKSLAAWALYQGLKMDGKL